MVSIGTQAGLRTEAFITDMDAPLGLAVGNALEVIECIQTLKGQGPPDVSALVEALAARMFVVSGRYGDRDARAAVREAIASGRALEKMRAMVEWQGGDTAILDDYSRLPGARRRQPVKAARDGYLTELKADLIGRASMALGAGRRRIEDRIDPGSGIVIAKKPGDQVSAGETILELLYNDDRGLGEASRLTDLAVRISSARPPLRPLVIGTIATGAQ
jgi:thymidine phosphorylase